MYILVWRKQKINKQYQGGIIVTEKISILREKDNDCETLLEGMNRGQKKVRKVHILGKASRKSTAVEMAMAPHSSPLAWRIPWTEEPGRLQSVRLLRVGHDWATSLSLFTFMHRRRKWQPTPVILPGEPQGLGSLVGCRLWVTQSRTWLKRLSSSSKSIADGGTTGTNTKGNLETWLKRGPLRLETKERWPLIRNELGKAHRGIC